MRSRYLTALLLVLLACGKHAPQAGVPMETKGEPLMPPGPKLPAELAFVPADVEAVVRVDLAQVAARSSDPAQSLKAIDFVLRAQQPAVWQVLHAAGIAP